MAHSLGSYVLLKGLAGLAGRVGTGSIQNFGEIVFAAPDVDSREFETDVRAIQREKVARRVTLYASENDWALYASRKLRPAYTRAGDAETLVLAPPMVSIDARTVNRGGSGHSYLTESVEVIEDIEDVLNGKSPEERKRLERVGVDPRVYWRFPSVRGESTNFGQR